MTVQMELCSARVLSASGPKFRFGSRFFFIEKRKRSLPGFSKGSPFDIFLTYDGVEQ